MKTVIIGDIHGCLEEFETLLEKCNIEEDDRLILLGDLMDRGPESYGVFQKVKQMKETMGENFVLVRGNHEEMLRDAIVYGNDIDWKRNHGRDTMKSFGNDRFLLMDCADWIEANMPYYYENDRFQCAHAGVYGSDIRDVDKDTLLWDRDMLQLNTYCGKLTIVGHTPIQVPLYFDGLRHDPVILPYGEWKDLPHHGIIDIDTGCVYDNKLTAMVIEDERYRLEYSKKKKKRKEES